MPERFISFLTPRNAIAAAGIIAVIAVGGVYWYVGGAPHASGVAVVRGSIVQTVEATGAVVPTESVDLGFERAGTIASIPVAVGSEVYAGQVLATLQSATLSAAREEAAANMAEAQAKLASLQSGTRPQALSTDRLAVAQALQAAYNAADDAVRGRADQFITNPHGPAAAFVFSASDPQDIINALNERVQLDTTLDALKAAIPSGDATTATNLVPTAQRAVGNLSAVASFLDTVSTILSHAIASPSTSFATIQTYQTSIGTARSEVATALSSLNTAAGVLNLAEAGATADDIAADQAAVAAAQAALDSAEAELAQTVLAAPIAGVVTRQDGNVGEVVSAGESFISLNSNARFEIDSSVSEIDVAKLHVGGSGVVHLDAYSSAAFEARIISIDPAATLENGVASYKIKAQFTTDDPRIRAGLTAETTFSAASSTDALLVPTSAVVTQGSATYVVKIGAGGTTSLTPVTVGIENPGGQTEVLSGLSEGDAVESFGTH